MAGWGGARSRSGPPPDPTSARSEQRGIAAGLLQLPASGYKYKCKRFPLPDYQVSMLTPDGDGNLVPTIDEEATADWRKREEELWRALWKTPQAVAWHMPQYRYLEPTVAMYCRQYRLCETPHAKAADRATLQRYADTIGLTPQGLRMLGWVIYDDKEKKRATRTEPSGNVVQFPDPRDEWESMT